MTPTTPTITPSKRDVRRPTLERAAGRLAAVGAALGVLAGLLDIVAGGSIDTWVGNKLDTFGLGLATALLSAVALIAAAQWLRAGRRESERRLGTALVLLCVGAVCFTTIGRLWVLPGVCLLMAGALILTTGSRRELTDAVDEHRWRIGLTAVLGGFYVFLGADALPHATGFVGIVSGLAIWEALRVAPRSRRPAVGLLVVGALAFAMVTWWSLVTPIIAILVLTVGPGALTRRPAAHMRRSPPFVRPVKASS